MCKRELDRQVAQLERDSRVEGYDNSKIKSKRGGNVEVLIQKYVVWPHECILGDVTK